MTRKLILMANKKNVTIIGPATVGGLKPGCFKIGNTGGMMDNILHSKLYRPGKWVESFLIIPHYFDKYSYTLEYWKYATKIISLSLSMISPPSPQYSHFFVWWKWRTLSIMLKMNPHAEFFAGKWKKYRSNLVTLSSLPKLVPQFYNN